MIPLAEVLVRPITSEKGVEMATNLNAYTFEILPSATKDDVREAVMVLLGVKRILSIRVLKTPGKTKVRRTARRLRQGRTKGTKKAIVSLPKEESLMEYFQPG